MSCLRRVLDAGVLQLVLVVSSTAGMAAQGRLRDLVFTGGMAAEAYQGNLSAVTLPVVDSVDEASAAIGEIGIRGDVLVLAQDSRDLNMTFDGGIRQFAAAGFELRDYAPREWMGTIDARFRQRVSDWGVLLVNGRARGRRVEDRTPIPLFLQPGYGVIGASVRLELREVRGIRLDTEVRGELSDYRALDLVSQLDLLDRRARGAEIGASWGHDLTVRFYGGYTAFRYPEQGTSFPPDPFRRDRTFHLGTQWTYSPPSSDIFAQIGVAGTINRSNSRRPEYNAVSVRANVFAPMPNEFGLNLFAVLNGKSYFTATEFARLIPGEEADNASVVYVQVDRPLATNLTGAVRLGWTRAETDIGNAYFQRYGGTFFLRYRP